MISELNTLAYRIRIAKKCFCNTFCDNSLKWSTKSSSRISPDEWECKYIERCTIRPQNTYSCIPYVFGIAFRFGSNIFLSRIGKMNNVFNFWNSVFYIGPDNRRNSGVIVCLLIGKCDQHFHGIYHSSFHGEHTA